MNKLLSILALSVALTASVSLAKNDNTQHNKKQFNVQEHQKRMIEKSKDCRYVCENGELVLYKGSRRASIPPQSGGGNINEMLSSFEAVDCPLVLDDGEEMKFNKYNQLRTDCKTKHSKK